MSDSATLERPLVSIPTGDLPEGDELYDLLAPISTALLDADESISEVALALERAGREKREEGHNGIVFTDSQAGALLLRARYYRELVEGVSRAINWMEEGAYGGSIFGDPDWPTKE
jgi:hypothetical protein